MSKCVLMCIAVTFMCTNLTFRFLILSCEYYQKVSSHSQICPHPTGSNSLAGDRALRELEANLKLSVIRSDLTDVCRPPLLHHTWWSVLSPGPRPGPGSSRLSSLLLSLTQLSSGQLKIVFFKMGTLVVVLEDIYYKYVLCIF